MAGVTFPLVLLCWKSKLMHEKAVSVPGRKAGEEITSGPYGEGQKYVWRFKSFGECV